MAISQINTVWKYSKASGTSLLLMLAIADNANDEGIAWPGIEYLALKTRMSERNIPRLVHKLEKMGELQVIREHGKSNRYKITTPIYGGTVFDRHTPDNQGITPDNQGITPDNSGIGPLTPRVITPDTQGQTTDIAMSPEPLTIKTNNRFNQSSYFEKLKDYLNMILGPKNRDQYLRYIETMRLVDTTDSMMIIAVPGEDLAIFEARYGKTINNYLTAYALESEIISYSDAETIGEKS